jgi:hypothetical protein
VSVCACSALHDSIRHSLPCGNGNPSVNSCCWSDSSPQADTGSTSAAASALTNPHIHAYADSYVHADGNANADSISHSYSHHPANGHTGTTSSSVGDVYWR